MGPGILGSLASDVGMRNRQIHDHGNTNCRMVYDEVRNQLGGLIDNIRTHPDDGEA